MKREKKPTIIHQPIKNAHEEDSDDFALIMGAVAAYAQQGSGIITRD